MKNLYLNLYLYLYLLETPSVSRSFGLFSRSKAHLRSANVGKGFGPRVSAWGRRHELTHCLTAGPGSAVEHRIPRFVSRHPGFRNLFAHTRSPRGRRPEAKP